MLEGVYIYGQGWHGHLRTPLPLKLVPGFSSF